jgi:FAD:protein FMN transferase
VDTKWSNTAIGKTGLSPAIRADQVASGRGPSPVGWLRRAGPALVLALTLIGCERPSGPLTLSGAALGTAWNVVLSNPPRALGQEEIQAAIEGQLEALDRLASDWRPDSEVSAINAWLATASGGEERLVSPELADLLRTSEQAFVMTRGCFDPTVGELVWALGFGSQARSEPLGPGPEREAIASRIGWNRLGFDSTRGSLRPQADVAHAIDLSAVAKGAAVDRVAAELERLGCGDFLIEVGGELVLRGVSPRGDLWRQGVDKPTLDPAAPREPALRFSLSQIAVATSGDYRQWREVAGERFSHVIDPRLGEPGRSRVASVTVLAPTCAQADALATGLMVLGSRDGTEVLRSLPDCEALFLEYSDAGRYQLSVTPGFPELELAPEFAELVQQPWPKQVLTPR